MKRTLIREVHSRIKVRITTAMWRQIYPAIQREHTEGGNEIMATLDELYHTGQTPFEPTSDAEMSAKQAGHTREIEEMNYGLLSTSLI